MTSSTSDQSTASNSPSELGRIRVYAADHLRLKAMATAMHLSTQDFVQVLLDSWESGEGSSWARDRREMNASLGRLEQLMVALAMANVATAEALIQMECGTLEVMAGTIGESNDALARIAENGRQS